MKQVFCLALCVFAFLALASADVEVGEKDWEQTLASNRQTIVKFYSPHCGTSHAYKHISGPEISIKCSVLLFAMIRRPSDGAQRYKNRFYAFTTKKSVLWAQDELTLCYT